MRVRVNGSLVMRINMSNYFDGREFTAPASSAGRATSLQQPVQKSMKLQRSVRYFLIFHAHMNVKSHPF